MKNPINLVFALFLFFSVSCKKKKEDPVQSTSSPAVVQVPQKVDGYIDVYYEYKISKGTIKFFQSYTHAMFYKQAHDNDSLYYLPFDADVGNMALNDSALSKEFIGPVIKYHYFPAHTQEAEQIKKTREWNISGNETFKVMTILDNTSLPEYFPTVLPDTIFKTADNTIKLGNYTGAAPIEVVIKFPLGSGYTRPRTPTRSAKTITFTESDFSSFFEFESVNVTIQLSLINTSYQTIEGKVLCLTSHIFYETDEIPFKF